VVVARDEGVSPAARNPSGHIDLRVASMADTLPFYEALLPALGFTQRYDGGDWKVFATEAPPPGAAYIGITESADFTANENRIAFWAADRAEVDRLAAVIADTGVALSGPKDMPYGPGYYAVYFTDPAGNRLEIYHRPPL
jgi:catechol 2,3-dioxygenase-like lactoylglutathione lyase family enzyme